MYFDTPLKMPRATHYGNNYWEVYSAKLKRIVTLYSNLEFENYLTLEMDPNVVLFCEQPLVIELTIDGKSVKTVFDFWVRYKDGSDELQEVKYLSELTGNDQASLRSQAQIEKQQVWCINNGVSYNIRNEENINKGYFYIRNCNIMASKVRRYIPVNIEGTCEQIKLIINNSNKTTIQDLINKDILELNNAITNVSYFYYLGIFNLNIYNKPLDFTTEITLWQ